MKIVLSGWRRARVVATGKTFFIYGVSQGPSAEKNPLHVDAKWTLRSVRGRGNS
jgi:hypothetical protein